MREATVHLLLPFALPAAAESAAILQARATPALDTLVRVARVQDRMVGEAYQRSLSHEQWLAAAYGIAPAHGDDDLPLAPYMMLADGIDPGEALWACVQPVHVEVAHDHLVLIDPQSLALSAADADILLRVARPSFDELDLTLRAPGPLRWYVSGARLGELNGAAPRRASGRSIDIWLPVAKADSQRSRIWMKLQNEVQMAWHAHPVNEAREARGDMSVNAIWLHGQGRQRAVAPAFSAVFSQACATRGLACASKVDARGLPEDLDAVLRVLQSASASAAAVPSPRPVPALVEIDTLSAPFIAQDWHGWLAAFADLDKHWFVPALDALREGKLTQLNLTLCGDTGSTTLNVRRMDLKKFWRRGTLASLLSA